MKQILSLIAGLTFLAITFGMLVAVVAMFGGCAPMPVECRCSCADGMNLTACGGHGCLTTNNLMLQNVPVGECHLEGDIGWCDTLN